MNNIYNYPVLSVVIPIYNNDRFISFCLDSLLVHQTIKKELYEIILVNDGSSDNSLSIIQSYANEYSNVSIINQENHGVSVARNHGMEFATGKFVWFVDGDDFVKANCIESILNDLKSDIEVYHFNGYIFNQKDFYEKMIFEEFQGTAQPDIWTYIFSLNFLNTHKIFFLDGIHYNETQLFINDVNLFNPKQKFSCNTYYYYRSNEFSSTATNKKRKISGYFDLFELLEERLEKKTYPIDNTLHQIESILRMRFLYAMDDMSIVTNEQIERGKKLSKYISDFIKKNSVPRKYKKAFKEYENLCKHYDSKDWKKHLYRWRKKHTKKEYIKSVIKHPRRFAKTLFNKN